MLNNADDFALCNRHSGKVKCKTVPLKRETTRLTMMRAKLCSKSPARTKNSYHLTTKLIAGPTRAQNKSFPRGVAYPREPGCASRPVAVDTVTHYPAA